MNPKISPALFLRCNWGYLASSDQYVATIVRGGILGLTKVVFKTPSDIQLDITCGGTSSFRGVFFNKARVSSARYLFDVMAYVEYTVWLWVSMVTMLVIMMTASIMESTPSSVNMNALLFMAPPTPIALVWPSQTRVRAECLYSQHLLGELDY